MLLLAISILISLSAGSAGISLIKSGRMLLDYFFSIGTSSADWKEGEYAIITQVRLPRIILAVLAGAALALAGAGFQGVLRNPLADPYTLGVASGSSLGAVIVIFFGWQLAFGLWTLPLIAFATGLLTLFFVLKLARKQGIMQMETLILSGVVIQAFLGAFVSFLLTYSQGLINQILFWLMGSMTMKSWEHIGLLAPFVAIGLPLLLLFSPALNLFVLGERHAAHMGVNTERTKLLVLVISSLLTAAAVSVSGVIGFVGLVVPHLIRLITGPDYRLLLPLSALGGGTFMLLADTLARTLLSPREIPLGVITALIGAPFFAYLLYRRKLNDNRG